MTDTDVFEHSTPELYDRYMGPLLFAPYAKHVASSRRSTSIQNASPARDAARGIVLGSPFRGEIERLDSSALERSTAAVEQALQPWDGKRAPMSAHIATSVR